MLRPGRAALVLLLALLVPSGLVRGSDAPGDGTWTSLGYGLPGVSGVPVLIGSGTLAPGSPGSLVLQQAAPSSVAILFVSLTSTPVPFVGGTLAAYPPNLMFGLNTEPDGSISVIWSDWPAGLPSGLVMTFQYGVHDAAGPYGASLSNALAGQLP